MLLSVARGWLLRGTEEDVVADEAITVSSAENCLGEDVKHLSAAGAAAAGRLFHSALP
jgi:hypothetical protein